MPTNNFEGLRPVNFKSSQQGLTLIELMVGLVIGLLATLIIMQVFSVFEGQKRTTSGTNDAQTSGSIALFTLQRDIQLAGYGLPLFDASNFALKCTTAVTYDHDNLVATPPISMNPIEIIDGGVAPGASDVVTVRYGNSASGGIPMKVIGRVGNNINVATNMGCNNNDAVFTINGNACAVTQVNDINLVTQPTQITVRDATGVTGGASNLSCLGTWNEFRYAVDANGNLTRTVNGVVQPIVAGIVNLQAQYGISANPTTNRISQWVNATGAWQTPGNISNVCDTANANRNCIKAVRVAAVARNGLLERNVVSSACSSTTAAAPTGVCTWDATSANPVVASPAPAVDLSNLANWGSYRYKVYESIVSLRNVVWSRERLVL